MNSNPSRKNNFIYVSLLIILITTLTPGDGKIAGNYLDKIVHAFIFLLLAVSISYKYHSSNNLWLMLFASILFGLLTEVIQHFIPGRNMEIYDMIADTLGVILGYSLYETYGDKIDKLIIRLGG